MIKFIARKVLILFLNIKKNSQVSYFAYVNNYTTLEGRNSIHSGARVSNAKIGYATFIGRNSILLGAEIGRYCSIGHDVEVLIQTHPSSKFISTHPAFYSTLNQAGFTFVKSQKFCEILCYDQANRITVSIGNDVWIGAKVTIIGGLKIGDGAIIAAGSVVTKDVPAYAVVGGVPAKLIRMRFNEKQVCNLLKLSWSSKSIEWLEEKADYFSDIDNVDLLVSGDSL